MATLFTATPLLSSIMEQRLNFNKHTSWTILEPPHSMRNIGTDLQIPLAVFHRWLIEKTPPSKRTTSNKYKGRSNSVPINTSFRKPNLKISQKKDEVKGILPAVWCETAPQKHPTRHNRTQQQIQLVLIPFHIHIPWYFWIHFDRKPDLIYRRGSKW